MTSSIGAVGASSPVPQFLPPGSTPAVSTSAPLDTSRGPAFILGSAAELNAKLRAQALDQIGAAGKSDETVILGPDGVERRKVRDAAGRSYEERRMRDPKTGRTMFLELAPSDGMGGKVSILVGNKAATVSFREGEIGKVPWDLVGKALGEIMEEQGLKAGDNFTVSMRVLP